MKSKFIFILSMLVTFQFGVFAQKTVAFNTLESSGSMKNSGSVNPPAEASSSSKSVIEFSVIPQDSKEIANPEDLEDHFLGREIAIKYLKFNNGYTYKAPIAPGNPATKTMFRKPAVYESVLKVEKYLKKEVKKGELTTEQAASAFGKVLDVANSTLYLGTSELENRIREANGQQEIVDLYTKYVKLNYN